MKKIFWTVMAAACVMMAGQAHAQTELSLSEQVEMLRHLPPDQRQAIIESLQSGDQMDPGLEFPEITEQREAPAVADEENIVEPRLMPGDTIVMDIQFSGDFETDAEAKEEVLLDSIASALIGDNVYKLDVRGEITVRGVGNIYLAGLTAEEAAVRIASEKILDPFVVEIFLLPLQPQGGAGLAAFGYELFEAVPTTFAPATDIPVPVDYVIGPGDQIVVQLFGSENREFTLVVGRDGILNFPEIGPISVGGLSFEDLREELRDRVANQMIGVTASVTMGELRSIRVFVLGDAVQPGSYTVSGLSTMTNALFASGGVKPIGSLRNIQLKRNGAVVARLDLYDLLLRGDTRNDSRLKPGDVIFIPPVGQRAGIGGEVRRPAMYELRAEKVVSELLRMAGGLRPAADPTAARLDRIDEKNARTVLDINLATRKGLSTTLRDGDTIFVERVLEEPQEVVSLAGHVDRDGDYQWYSGMRLSHLIPRLELLKPKADTHYVLVVRELSADGRIEATSADLLAALNTPGSLDDIKLRPRDRVLVFSLDIDRSRIVEPILDDLRMQAIQGEPTREVRIGGLVRAPGKYPLESEMRLSDLLRAGGGLTESAYALHAELTRYSIVSGRYRIAELVEVDLEALRDGDERQDIGLRPYDYLTIKEISDWGQQEEVVLDGEIKFPGTYQIRRGEALSSIINRAGGLTDLAFSEGSVYTRDALRFKEQEQLDQLARRLELDLAAVTLTRVQENPQAAQALALGQSLVDRLKDVQAVGRLVIDLDALLASPGDPTSDIVMQNGDRLYVPERTQEVTVIGEVQYATSHIFDPGLRRDDYINSSGGFTQKADKKRVYVVRANGAVLVGQTSRWFKGASTSHVRPGDTIVVPLDADRVSKLTLVTSVSQVIFQLGVLAAAATN